MTGIAKYYPDIFTAQLFCLTKIMSLWVGILLQPASHLAHSELASLFNGRVLFYIMIYLIGLLSQHAEAISSFPKMYAYNIILIDLMCILVSLTAQFWSFVTTEPALNNTNMTQEDFWPLTETHTYYAWLSHLILCKEVQQN